MTKKEKIWVVLLQCDGRDPKLTASSSLQLAEALFMKEYGKWPEEDGREEIFKYDDDDQIKWTASLSEEGDYLSLYEVELK